MKEYHLKEEQWQDIYKILEERDCIYTKQEKKLRRFIEGVYYVLRGGIQWRMLPHYYGKWKSVYRRFNRWSKKGIWDIFFEKTSKNADLTEVMLDGTIVRSHACSAGYGKDSQKEQALGRSKGGFTTKIHAMVDSLGNPKKFILTGGEVHDVVKASELIEEVRNAHIIADKAYDSDELREQIEKQGCTPVIPPRSNRKIQHEYDKDVYKERHLIECFFGKLKHFRRVFSRFDKMKSTFQSFINFASALILLR
jgi:transposase